MYTYTVKQGDIAKFPNGVEVNYDAVNETLVIKASPGNVPVMRTVPESRGFWTLRFE